MTPCLKQKELIAFQAWIYLEDAVDIAKRLKYYQLRSDAMKGSHPCHLSLCFVSCSQYFCMIQRFQSSGLPAFTHCMLRITYIIIVQEQHGHKVKPFPYRLSRAVVLEPELNQHVLLHASMHNANQLCLIQTKPACCPTLIQTPVTSQACSCVTRCCSQQNGTRTFTC